MANKTLLQLSEEYSESIKTVDSQIEFLRKELAKARKAHRNILAGNITRKLTVLYRQRSELEEIEEYLRTYYDKEMRCAV